MVEYLSAALVLTRGPALLPRRLSVRVRTDGTPLFVGRAHESDLVLDANLLFASQHHCQLIVRSLCAAPKEKADAVQEGKEENHRSDTAVNEYRHTRRSRISAKQEQTKQYLNQRHHQQLELCLVDVGSSNGTFINDIRVENDTPTPMHHGDVIVFGGMRDVAAGASLPQTCGPEIVMWRITLNDNDSPFAVEETPAVFLSPDYIESEEKRMTLQLLLQQTITQSPRRAVSPTANCDSLLADAPPPTVVKGWCSNRHQYEQHQQQSPQTPVACESLQRKVTGDNIASDRNAEIYTSTRRSGTVAAAVVLEYKNTEWASPTAIPLRGVRLHGSSFNVSQTSSVGRGPKRSRGQDTRRKAENNSSVQPHELTLTKEHWEWTMNSDVGTPKKQRAGREQQQQCAVRCTIPWADVQRIMYCPSKRAITVLLREKNHLSFPGHDATTPEVRFATWLMEDQEANHKDTTTAPFHKDDTFLQLLDELSRLSETNTTPKPQPLEEEEFIAHYAPVI